MTMHLLPVYYTTTKYNKRAKKKKVTAAQLAHAEWIKNITNGCRSDKKILYKMFKADYDANMKVDRNDYGSAGMSGTASSCAKRGVMVNLHKEKPEVQAQILDKASRVMPLYNKGGLQLLTNKDDLKYVGTLSRRG